MNEFKEVLMYMWNEYKKTVTDNIFLGMFATTLVLLFGAGVVMLVGSIIMIIVNIFNPVYFAIFVFVIVAPSLFIRFWIKINRTNERKND